MKKGQKDKSRGTPKKVGKAKKTVTRDQSKATKAKIHKLNEDLESINQITQLASASHKSAQNEHKTVLDVKSLKSELSQQKRLKEENKQVETDLTKQLELITGMGI